MRDKIKLSRYRKNGGFFMYSIVFAFIITAVIGIIIASEVSVEV